MRTNTSADVFLRTDAAKFAGVAPDTIERAADRGALPCRRTSRGVRVIQRADLEQWITQRATRRRSTT